MWVDQFDKFATKHNLRKWVGCWTGKSNVRLHGVPQTARYYRLIDLIYAHVCQERKRSRKAAIRANSSFFVDLSQNPGYRTFGEISKIALRCNTFLYDYHEDRVVLPREHLQFCGYLKPDIERMQLSDLCLRGMAGECQSLPVLGAFLAPLVAHNNFDYRSS